MRNTRINILLLKRNLTGVNVARMLEITPNRFDRIRNGHENNRTLKEKVALFLGKPVDYLWEKDGKPKIPK